MTKAMLDLKSLDIVLKVASRCNLKCTYCHWFRDPEVLDLPKVMSEEIEHSFFSRLEELLSQSRIDNVNLILHGGEPLLWGYERVTSFLNSARNLGQKKQVKISFSITTNGLLLSPKWLKLFLDFEVGIAISVDGPADIHDASRIYANGKGSFAQVVDKIELSRMFGIEPALLSVAHQDAKGHDIVNFFAEQLQAKRFDLLIPNFTHADAVPDISDFYISAFDAWYEKYWQKGAEVRHFVAMIEGLLGMVPRIESIGRSAVSAMVIQPNGAIEPHDVLRICGHEMVDTGLNLERNRMSELFEHPLWQIPFEASQTLPKACRSCEFSNACGGGYLMHRFNEGSFDHPSVYCGQLKSIFRHIYNRITKDIYLESNEDITHVS